MSKTILTNDDENTIIKLYQSENISTHELGKRFSVGHKKITKILNDNLISIKKRGGQVKGGNSVIIEKSKTNKYIGSDGKKFIAVCKKTKLEFDDPNNLSGVLTNHIIKTYGDVPIPNNTYQRKKYELEYGKKWFEEYFDIIEVEEALTRKCKLCDWVTSDVDNRTGCFENHLIKHEIGLNDYLVRFPEDIVFHKNYIKNKDLLLEDNHVICNICGKKLRYLGAKHLNKHGITLFEYRIKYPNDKILSNRYKDELRVRYDNGLRLHENVFSSKAQIEIYNHIVELGFTVKMNDKKLLSGVEIDILIDDLKLGIEYNGLYYHSEKFGKDRQFHLTKTKLMNSIGYRLIHIFEDEWFNNKELVLNKIDYILGVNKNKNIGARKCDIREVDLESKKEFLKKYHIQGNDSTNICLGAFFNNKLVAIMTFNGVRGMNSGKVDGVYDLSRFATTNEYKITGIANKLMKHFIKLYQPEKIISFGDVRWIDGNKNMYLSIGFKCVKILGPDYRYFNSSISRTKRLHKFGFGKNSLKKKFPHLDFSKSEKQLMTELGYDRIWDCGLFKYEFIVD